jgi:hypothetical protein
MRPRAIYVGILLYIIFLFISCIQQDDFPVLKGPYLGQKPPGMTPEIFAPGIISTGHSERIAAFTPDGKYFFFTSNRILHKSYSEIPLTYEKKLKIMNSPGNGSADIYWVDAKIIEDLKPKRLNLRLTTPRGHIGTLFALEYEM